MCGIVGASAQRNVEPILLEGLRRLEYRGYDSAGMALVNGGVLDRTRAVGKVQALADKLEAEPRPGTLGVAHTRWATHGGVSEINAHPHTSADRVAVVHNGIIENFESLKQRLIEAGYAFTSQTDTEVVAHLIESYLDDSADLAEAVRRAVAELHGAYALAVVSRDDPQTLVATRSGSPLVLGVGIGEHFVASDVAALLPVTRNFVYLEEGDLVVITPDTFAITDLHGAPIERPVKESGLSISATEKGGYRHFMLKEIYEQPQALTDTWQGRLSVDDILASSIGTDAEALLSQVEAIHIVACGTSYHAGLVARYWLEAMARIPCNVELASEYRYRNPVVPKNCLFVTLSQSGETADTLAALRYAKDLPQGQGYLATLAVCNKPESSLTRESDLVMMTRAGPEIGVASTKAFTTQLLCLLLLTGMLDRDAQKRGHLAADIRKIHTAVSQVLELDDAIRHLAEEFVDKQHALFLGRGPMYPIAMEGALKLKEISYLHAEAYAAGELKHGPLALVDENMPVIAVAPKNDWLEKVKSNLQEVSARGGKLYVFADADAGLNTGPGMTVLDMPHVDDTLAPIAYTVPLQLLAYHVAVAKGTDVDQPRNLAKSVTVE
ncbi:glutamine--fructose-6-phosphate transaminase (isomerizing) [Salinisphaera aquimarina]|uniref:Glutamine--fructose-6-phosphate aminotransferase [isomerizing] n=1 Tax=Salinisphaera aquimarina TaxID=2094031 RepID=A0ABV7ELW4_9GAMM